jgi:hypothetical protein
MVIINNFDYLIAVRFLTRSNLLKQLPDGNGIILRLTEIVAVSN